MLDIADVPGLRPTSERIRETLFNWLAPTLPGSRCLDLFAGTGALGLEALSRGAAEVVFVEESPVAARALQASVELLDASGAEIRRGDAFEFLRRADVRPFDIVFLDPPFAADSHEDLCRLLDETPVLADGALIYIEEDRAKPAVKLPARWTTLKSKTAGNVRYSLAQVDGES